VLYNSLNAMKAKQLDVGKFADGQGLWLHKRNKQHGKWILRLVVHGKRREMGLGRWPDVSIAEARERAAKARKQVRDDLDPIEERRKTKYTYTRNMLKDVIAKCHEAKKAELKGERNQKQWLSPLSVHVIPKLGDMAVESIDQHVVKSVLDPIWHKKPEVARKVMNRMNITLKYAAALGLDVDLQATSKARALLGKRDHKPTHIPSLPYAEVPAFYRMLCTKNSMTCLALRFLILTATRTGEVRMAQFDEIQDDIWILPPERTKTGIEHRVPLSGEALNVISLASTENNLPWLFPTRKGKVLSDMAMSMFMRKEKYEARPHGFRSSFRTWAENETDADWETKETSLGHAVGSTVERSYQRSDLLEKRRALMQNWAHFLTG